jgi:Mg-chelatase subunit ChlD
MTLLAPIGLAALLLAAPIILLHMLTPRRPATPVSSLLHWEGMRQSITAAEPWQRLEPSLLLLLQLLAVALLALALAMPARVTESDLAEHTVFIVDASGSMSAIDGSPDRLGAAIDRAGELRASIPEGGVASVVVASPNPVVLLAADADQGAFDRALATIRSTAGPADYEAAFTLAESLKTADRPTGYVLLSDGGLDEVEQGLAPLGSRFEPVGATDTNRAITDLSVTSGPAGMQARVTIESTGGPDATQELRVDVDGRTEASREVVIPEGATIEETFELPLGSEVAAYLDGEDLIAFDNQRYVAASVPGTLKVRVYGEATFFLDQLLAAIPDVDTAVAPGEDVDLEIFAGVPVPRETVLPFIAIDVPGGIPGVVAAGRVEDPIPTLVSDDPLLESVDVSGIAIADAQILDVESGDVLLAAPGAPLLVRGSVDGVPFFYFAFTLEQSNLPVNVAFPIIGSRMVGDLTAAEGSAASFTVGDRIQMGGDGGRVIDPRGGNRLIGAGEPGPVVDLAGFWVVEREGEEPVMAAVNADTGESHAKPIGELPGLRSAPAPAGEVTGTGTARVATSVLSLVIGALLLVLGAELVVSRRRRGVTTLQWRLGLAARAVIVGLLLLVLVNPVIDIADDSVKTVFVVDVSDSLGSSVDTARSWVDSAITDAGDGRWAVVEVGADARVAVPVGTAPYEPAESVDATATNLGRGLRLAASLLDGESRERVVVVSDGRDNSGDLQDELDRLKDLGIVVDVHTVPGEARADAAVASIDVPSHVGEGEAFDVVVDVESSVSARAVVESRSAGEVTRRVVDLKPGSNPVSFTATAGAPGLHPIEATVHIEGDAVTKNDQTRTAVEVRGPGTVLLVEGSGENAAPIEAALESRGLVVVASDPESLPTLEGLTLYQAVMLVNVSARELTDGQVEALDGFVSDLGRGLVVVGGTDTYALGGYQDTALEALLPVDSEAVDPEKQVPVAEVLLIDTSESMGACHCKDNGQTMEEGSGPNKTDIAKAASVRAADALTELDDLGVLAFSGTARWVVPVQPLPSPDVIQDAIGGLRPFGETRVVQALEDAAAGLRASDKTVKHIILFTDGFTTELDLPDFGPAVPGAGSLVDEVAALADEGITVSVVGTGEGAIPQLEEVAEAGRGRFYPGRDLNEIPEIFVKESRLASRAFINEGEFYPAVTSTAAAVRNLASSPALLGFVATTPKETADVQLQIGELADPLLATWRVGLGKVTAWTSDDGERWASQWAAWDGFADFWSAVVRDTFPLSGAEGQQVNASIRGGLLTITLEGSDPWPTGTAPVARVRYPGGASEEIPLERTSDFEFEGYAPAREGGAYAVGVAVEGSDDRAVVLSAIASRSFAAEYLPGEADPELLTGVSEATGGRGEITAAQAFEDTGLEPGSKPISLRWVFLLLAALLWPLDVALRRLRLSRRERSAGQGPRSEIQAAAARGP